MGALFNDLSKWGIKRKKAIDDGTQNLINISTDKNTEKIQKIKDIKSDEFSKI